MTVQRYDLARTDSIEEFPEGDYVLHSDYVALAGKLEAELRAVWAEHFLLSRENATLLKERISLSRDVQRLTRELAEARALLETPVRVWQD